jgi:hydroxymethylpyrimidine/phosphomethylpyrimidine kinase
MVSESGAALLEPDARTALVERLLPRVTVITPNVPEARALLEVAGRPMPDGSIDAVAEALHVLGPDVVVITGGHREQATDVFYDGEQRTEFPGERYADGAAHGSGCTHSSVLAARLAHGDDPVTAARAAKAMASRAVAQGLRSIGAGPGPVDVLGVVDRD